MPLKKILMHNSGIHVGKHLWKMKDVNPPPNFSIIILKLVISFIILSENGIFYCLKHS